MPVTVAGHGCGKGAAVGPWGPGQCRRCWNRLNNPKFAGIAVGAPAAGPTLRGRCLHVGPRLTARDAGPSCQAPHGCQHPDAVSRERHPLAVPGQNCQSCPDWEADQ